MAYVDLYCERIAPGLLGEPINTLSNLAFFAAAWWVWRHAAMAGAGAGRARWLAWLLALIGAGSFTFHAFATGWAEWLDVLPILLFQLVFLWRYFRDIAGWLPLATGLFLLGFVAAGVEAGNYPQWLNGSLSYLPALLVLLGIGVWHRRAGLAGGGYLVAAAATFAVSLMFRSIDNVVCPGFTVGTHFLWHFLNAVVLALAVRGWMLGVSASAAGRSGIVEYGRQDTV
ncbi:ceramidase domain-containing protein [Pseudogulbenkiania sp. MAI-1]|uniref:ceramidase domain-containing protein n=1 Tax=Pseudogulbenkiania sp. MAI-1 TaxID=990370 RepID=UPI00045E64C3|nr:ceramidase domain-containing protein [Pseudogulbenkiania sp. MAI-1]